MVLIVAFAISCTFAVAMVYSEFILHGNKINTLEKDFTDQIQSLSNRMENKDKRAVQDRANLWKVVNSKQDK